MARISTYGLDEALEGGDKIIGSDVSSNYATMNFSLDQLGEFYSRTGSAQSSVTFTFDVGTGYPNDELESEHAYFNGITFDTINELRFSNEAHLEINTEAFAAILPGTLISINQVGDNRGANYGFFEVTAVSPYSVNGVDLGYTATIEKIDGTVTYIGDIPSDYVSITPYGQAANITGSVGTIGFSTETGVFNLESQEVSLIGWENDGTNDILMVTENGTLRALNLAGSGGGGSGTITGVTAGTGISGGGNTGTVTLDLDFSELTNVGNLVSDTQIIVHTASGSEGRIDPANIPLSLFDNTASGFTGDQDVTFNTLSGQAAWPTTLSGYGITDGGGDPNQTIQTTSPITGAAAATANSVTIGIDETQISISATQLSEVDTTAGNIGEFLNERGQFVAISGGTGSNGQSVDVYFADDAVGTNASQTRGANQDFIGFAEFTAPATSTAPAAFVQFVGDEGRDGQNVEIYYADDADGTNASTTKGSKEFIAFATYTTTPIAPTGVGSYTKISGDTGATGTSVQIFYADDADGTNPSTTRGSKEYIAFATFIPPATATAPTGTGSYDKITADDGQSIQIFYASDANGTGASTTQGSNEFIAFVPFTPPASPAAPSGAGSFTRFTGGTVTLPTGTAGQVLGYSSDGTNGTPLSFSGTTGTSGTDYIVQFTSTGGPITAKVNVPATSGTGRIPDPFPTREERTQNAAGDPLVFNLTITDANHPDITYVINSVAPTFVGGTGFTAPTPAGTGNTIAVTATDVSTTAMTINLTATDGLSNTMFTQDHTITLVVSAFVPPPGDQYFYDEFSSILTPEYVSIAEPAFKHGGELATGDSFIVNIPVDGEYAVVNIQNTVTTSPTFTADGGIGLTPDGVFAAADSDDMSLRNEGFTSYWMAMNQGTHTITIRFS